MYCMAWRAFSLTIEGPEEESLLLVDVGVEGWEVAECLRLKFELELELEGRFS
jgi:hypothetical protein